MELDDLMEDYYKQKQQKLWCLLKKFLNKKFHLKNLRFLSRMIYSNNVFNQHFALIGFLKIMKFSENSNTFEKKFIIKIFFQSNVLPRFIEFLFLSDFPYLQFASLSIFAILLKLKIQKRIGDIIALGAINGFLNSLTSKYEGIARQVSIKFNL